MAKRSSGKPIVRSFPPISTPDARVLILGTVPSIASLAKRQFYGHPHNAFWRIMGELFGAGRDLPYDERKRILGEHGVAVWDVLKQCERPGSLDTSICRASEVPTNIAGFLRKHPQVRTIFFNGGKAESAFRQHVLPNVAKLKREFRYVRLPSTSPAHAGRSFAEKLEAWREVERALEQI